MRPNRAANCRQAPNLLLQKDIQRLPFRPAPVLVVVLARYLGLPGGLLMSSLHDSLPNWGSAVSPYTATAFRGRCPGGAHRGSE